MRIIIIKCLKIVVNEKTSKLNLISASADLLSEMQDSSQKNKTPVKELSERKMFKEALILSGCRVKFTGRASIINGKDFITGFISAIFVNIEEENKIGKLYIKKVFERKDKLTLKEIETELKTEAYKEIINYILKD